MKRVFQLMRLTFKSVRALYYIPVAVLFLAVPVSNYICIQMQGLETGYVDVMNTAQIAIPIMATWWIFCLLNEHIEGSGNELLHINGLFGKTKAVEVFCAFLWYCLHFSILFIAYSLLYGRIIPEFFQIVIQSFVFASLFYFLLYLLKNVTMAYMLVAVYYFMTVFFSRDNMFSYISIFTLGTLFSLEQLVRWFGCFAAGLLLFAAGAILNRNFYR